MFGNSFEPLYCYPSHQGSPSCHQGSRTHKASGCERRTRVKHRLKLILTGTIWLFGTGINLTLITQLWNLSECFPIGQNYRYFRTFWYTRHLGSYWSSFHTSNTKFSLKFWGDTSLSNIDRSGGRRQDNESWKVPRWLKKSLNHWNFLTDFSNNVFSRTSHQSLHRNS